MPLRQINLNYFQPFKCMKKRFSPQLFLKENFDKWWFVSLLMILGGLIGLFLSSTQPPIYESQADFSITIDYTRTGLLSDIDQDQAMLGVGNLMNSDEVLQKSVEKANTMGYSLTLEEFKEKTSVEREGFTWSLRVRDESPKTAAELVNVWADEADNVYQSAALHALKAEQYLLYLDSLVNCFQRSTIFPSDNGICTLPNLVLISEEIQQTGKLAYQEKQASLGLMPAISAQLVERGQVIQNPIRFNRNTFIMAGVFVGFAITLLIQLVSFDRRFIDGKRG